MENKYCHQSCDPAAQKMLKRAEELNIETVWDRYAAQEPQCGFGQLGLCCRVCSMGPCRVDPFGDGPQKGVCGAGADTIVARNLVRTAAAGASSHVDHGYEYIQALKKAAQGEIPYPIKDEGKLKAIAAKLGLSAEGKTKEELALAIAEIAAQDFANTGEEPMKWVTASAPAERVEAWKKLGVAPRNPDRDIRSALSQTNIGTDADPVNMLLTAVRMGLVDAYGGLHLTTDLQDIIFGTPTPVASEANLGVLKEDKVNIVVHGHVPLMSEKLVEWANKLNDKAIVAGAAGIQLAGICCSGNEILMRQGVPIATNFLSQELAIATGVVDAIVVDIQCIMPSLTTVAECFHTKVITTMPIAKIPGATHVDFNLEEADAKAQEIIELAIANYRNRDKSKVHIPQEKTSFLGGFSVEAIVGALAKVNAEDPLKPLVDNIAAGNILGAAALVGCNTVKLTQDSVHVGLAKELLKNNVLIVSTGCAAQALAKAGLMNPAATEQYAGEGLKAVLTAVGQAAGLNAPLPPVLHMGSCVDNSRIADLLSALAGYLKVNVKDLPIAASAPEFMSEKAIAIGTWAVAMGILTHLGPTPQVLGSPIVTGVLTDKVEELLGGKFIVEADPVKAAATIINHIIDKRQKLGLTVPQA
ncbi:MAG: anaerobic carbon-monoxide dehydrogenase catalytic subunit [Clostridia bacterium]|nr:anaerobic carbon-monoxide dehydrogenase catalytic subunit [Clostridia bacterium]